MSENANIKTEPRWITIQVTKYLHKVAGIKEQWISLGDDFFVKISPETFRDEKKFEKAVLDNLKKRGKYAIDFKYVVTRTMAKGGKVLKYKYEIKDTRTGKIVGTSKRNDRDAASEIYDIPKAYIDITQKSYYADEDESEDEFAKGGKIYRIATFEKPYNRKVTLFSGTKKECEIELPKFKKEYSDAEVQEVTETLEQALLQHRLAIPYEKGGNVTTMPIIARITTKPLNYTLTIGDKEEKKIMPPSTHDVVAIEEMTSFDGSVSKIYITNQWYKEHKRIPLVIIEGVVDKIEMLKAKGGEVLKRYATDIDFYQYAKNDEEVIEQAKKVVNDMRDKLDNQAQINEIREVPFASLKSRKLENVPKYAEGGEIEYYDMLISGYTKMHDLEGKILTAPQTLKMSNELAKDYGWDNDTRKKFLKYADEYNGRVYAQGGNAPTYVEAYKKHGRKATAPFLEDELWKERNPSSGISVDENAGKIKIKTPKKEYTLEVGDVSADEATKRVRAEYPNFTEFEYKRIQYKKRGKKGEFLTRIEPQDVLDARWDKKKNRIRQLSENIKSLRNNVTRDLNSEDEKTFLCALIVAIMDKTGERVGNDESADNGHYGVTGFRQKHVSVRGDQVEFDYVGKSGVKHEKMFSDEKIAKGLKRAMKDGKGLFVFTTSQGQRIRASQVNDYLSKFGVTAKDIRGYSANKWTLDKLKEVKPEDTDKKRKRQLNIVLKQVAAQVGHGAATLKKHYLMPEVVSEWIDNGKLFDITKAGYVMKKGGEIKSEEMKHIQGKDLFDDWEKLPKKVRDILMQGDEDGATKAQLDKMIRELKPLGYTFDYGLALQGYNLRKIKAEGGTTNVYSTEETKRIADTILHQIPVRTRMYVGAHQYMFGEKDGKAYLKFKASGAQYKKGLYITIFYNEAMDWYEVKGDVVFNYKHKEVGNYDMVHNDQLSDFILKITEGDKRANGGELAKGVDVEKEHKDLYLKLKRRLLAQGVDMPMSEQEFYETIAKRHLKEDEDYYKLLMKYVEKKKIEPTRKLSEQYADKIARKKARLDISKEYNKPNNPFDDTVPSENWRKYALPEDTKIYFSDFAKGGTIITEDMVYEMHEWVRDAATTMEEARKWDLINKIAKHFKISEKLAEYVVSQVIISKKNETEIYQGIMRMKQKSDECRSMKGMFAKGGSTNKNWIVRIYNDDNKVIDKFIIKDRTEHDALSEAEHEMDRRSQHQDYDDWTISELKKKEEGGMTDKEISDLMKKKGTEFEKAVEEAVKSGKIRRYAMEDTDKHGLIDTDYELIKEIEADIEKEKMAKGGQAGVREVVFTKKVNPQVKVIVKVQGSRIIEIINERKVHFPFHKGQMFQMNVQEWARVNGYSMDGKNLDREEKIFGIRVSDVPQGHEWRYIYPNKFREEGGEMAKGGALKYYDKDNEYRLGRPSGSIEKEILDKVKDGIPSERFVGSFGWKTPDGKRADGYLYKLDDFDKGLVKNIQLKDGEMIFRYVNRTTAISGSMPMIKINVNRELVYFMVANENDDIIFETRGVPALWIALIQHKLAEGGLTNEDIISKYQLWGKGIRLKFKNDQATYYSKNIHPDRKSIFVTSMNGFVIKNKKIADIVAIENKPLRFAEGGEVGENDIKENDKVTHQGDKGGMLDGPSHADGGIKTYVRANNDYVEVEGGESIINKHAMAMQEKVICEGTPAGVASAVNQLAGNGVKFADDGKCKIVKK